MSASSSEVMVGDQNVYCFQIHVAGGKDSIRWCSNPSKQSSALVGKPSYHVRGAVSAMSKW